MTLIHQLLAYLASIFTKEPTMATAPTEPTVDAPTDSAAEGTTTSPIAYQGDPLEAAIEGAARVAQDYPQFAERMTKHLDDLLALQLAKVQAA